MSYTAYSQLFGCADHLRYHQLNNFDRDLNHLDEVYNFSSHPHQIVSEASDDRKLLVCERGALLFVFNFHTTEDYVDLKVLPCFVLHVLVLWSSDSPPMKAVVPAL